MTFSHSTASSGLTGSPFPATLWEPVLRAAEGDSPAAQEALRTLCATYRQPVYAFLRRRGHDHHRAEDLCNGFIEYLLEKNRFQGFVRKQTKFRSFLIECLDNYVGMKWREDQARKRGGGAEVVEFEETMVPARPSDLAATLDRGLARQIHQLVCARLEEKYAKTGKLERLRALSGFIFGDKDGDSYAAVGQRLGLTTNHVRQEIFKLRETYYEFFRARVADTATAGELDEEMHYLLSLLVE